ncbi:MAG: efflux RND transporter periplasmic adaptor subunit [Candidatus Aminicenantes bacterium]|nr:efflux RND transporter periplasmic adaptor subunit [Candidatus Aminicenantes bacterium]
MRILKYVYFILILIIAVICIGFMNGCSEDQVTLDNSIDEDFIPDQIVGIGRIEPELRILDLNTEVSGIVTQIYFKPGDFISEGQTMIELSNAIEEARLEQEVAKIQIQIHEIEAAEAALASTRVKKENAEVSYNRTKKLLEEKVEAKSDYDRAKAEFESLAEDIKRLEALVVSAQNRLKQYQADKKLAQAEYDRKIITAPTDGQLLAVDITLGSLVSPETPFGTFAIKSPLVARCEIDELFADQVRAGQEAFVRFQGKSDPIAKGNVSFAGPYLRKKSIFSDEVGELEDRRVREVWIRLEEGTELLFGTRIECVIQNKK